MDLINELPFQNLFQGKRCGFFFRQFWNNKGKHKKHGHPQKIALLTILKKMSKTHHFNKKLKSNFTHKTFILTWSLTKHKKKHKAHGHKQTIALFTIFKSMSKTHHFSDIFKTNFTHKKKQFSSKPFAPHSINIQLNENYSK